MCNPHGTREVYIYIYIYIYKCVCKCVSTCIHLHIGVSEGAGISDPPPSSHYKILGVSYVPTPPPRNDFILQIILLHTRFYRYDVHDTILLNHIHFWLIIGDAIDVLKKIKISKLCYSYVIVLYIFINNCP